MWWLISQPALAGLGPADVVVVYNADDPQATDVADAYAVARALPGGHLCGLTGIDPALAQIDFATFDSLVLTPFEACLDALPDPDEIDAVVTVRGLPYVVTLPTYVVGLEAALQVGRGTGPLGELIGSAQSAPGGLAQASVLNPTFAGIGAFCAPGDLLVDNPYSGWYRATCALQDVADLPAAFERPDSHVYQAYDLTGELFVVSRLDGFDYDDALALIDRAVAADGAFPTAPVVCMAGADEARAARDPECELTTRRLAESGVPSTWIAPFDPALSGIEVSAYFTGAADLRGAIDGLTFAPGAVADNLTSYGALPQNFVCDDATGTCPASESQTSIARFVRAGATAAHGTVAEPLNNPFPNAGALVLYTSGYTLGESFLYGEQFLYWQNLLLGDPLVAPWAERPVVTVPTEAPSAGELVATATHPSSVVEVRLYVDGVRVATGVGDTAVWTVDRAEGEVVDVLAVALASPAPVYRPGWPVAAGFQLSHADTQGWTSTAVTIGPPAPPAETTGDTGAAGTTGLGDDDDDDGVPTGPDGVAPTGDDGGDDDGARGGCGCASGGVHGWGGISALAGLGVLAARRRRGRR